MMDRVVDIASATVRHIASMARKRPQLAEDVSNSVSMKPAPHQRFVFKPAHLSALITRSGSEVHSREHSIRYHLLPDTRQHRANSIGEHARSVPEGPAGCELVLGQKNLHSLAGLIGASKDDIQ